MNKGCDNGRLSSRSVTILVQCAAVLFDCDGVLVDSDASIRRSFERWATPHGIDGSRLYEVSRGRRSIDSIRIEAPHLDSDARERSVRADRARRRVHRDR